MANVIINDVNLTNIANAIRGKNGETTTYKPSEMAAAITAIPSGGGGGDVDEQWIQFFSDRSGLTTFNFPPGTTMIPRYCFDNCSNLVLTSLPNTINTVETYGFYNCSNLTLTSLPENLSSMGSYAFAYTGISITRFPSGVYSIPGYSFMRCPGLTKINIHSGISYIYNYAFRYCENLTEVVFGGTATSNISTVGGTISNSAFANCDSLTSIKVPWAEGAVSGAPWGATNATITYNYIEEA